MALLAASATTLIFRGLIALVALSVGRFFYRGYVNRRMIHRFKAQGIVSTTSNLQSIF